MIWKNKPTLDSLKKMGQNTAHTTLDIEFIEIGDDYLKAKMPVDARHVQPMRLLHGGMNVVLAESLGSVAGVHCVDFPNQTCVGLEINANHIKSVKENEGFVTGTVKPVHIGKTTHIWEIKIENDKQQLVCISRITLAVIDLKK